MSVYEIRSAEHQETVTGHHTPVTRIGAMDLTEEALQLKGYEYQEVVSGHHTPATRWRGGLDVAGTYESQHFEYVDAYGITRYRGTDAREAGNCDELTLPAEISISTAVTMTEDCSTWGTGQGACECMQTYWNNVHSSGSFTSVHAAECFWDATEWVWYTCPSIAITYEKRWLRCWILVSAMPIAATLQLEITEWTELLLPRPYSLRGMAIDTLTFVGGTAAERRAELIAFAAEPHTATLAYFTGSAWIPVSCIGSMSADLS